MGFQGITKVFEGLDGLSGKDESDFAVRNVAFL